MGAAIQLLPLAAYVVATALGAPPLLAAAVMIGTSIAVSSTLANPERTMNVASRGALTNTASTVESIPVIYGTRKVGGNRCLVEVTDSATYKQRNLHLVFTLCEGEISAINNVYLDDRLSGSFQNVTPFKFTGTDDQVASADLISAFAVGSPPVGKWTTAHRGRGIAYVYLKLVWNPNDFPTGMPSLFTFDVDGKKVWDPRAEGSPSTLTFSNNPALCILDYLMNERYGCGVPVSMIAESTFVTAANYFDELVTVPVAGSPSTTTQKRYTCNGILYPEAGYFENLNALLSSCRSMLVFSAGKWKLIPEKVETPSTFEFTEDNIVGSWTVRKGGKRERFNRVRARWFNPAREWTEDLAIYESASHLAEDNGMVLENEIALPFTTNVYTALQLAQIEEKTSRQGVQCEFTATVEGMRCEVGDVVPITHTTTGWDAKPFRIMGIGLLSNDEVKITAREYQASNYTLDLDDLVSDVPDTNLPNLLDDLTVVLGTPSSGTNELFVAGDGTVVTRIRVPIVRTGSPDGALNAFITEFQVQFARTTSPTEWQDAPMVDADATEVFVYPVEDGIAYDVRVRAFTVAGNSGAWSYALNHTVVGKTALPSDVTGFSAQQNGPNVNFRWDQVADADLAGYEIRYNDAGVIDWDSAAVVTSVTRGTAITNGFVPPGTWELLIKARDTSFNYSQNPDTATLTVINENEVLQQRDEAPDWPGTRTNMVHHWTGKLIPDSQSLASALGWEVFDQTVPNPYATCGYTAREMDIGFDDTVRVWADVVSTLAPDATEPEDQILGLDYRMEAGSYDGFEIWSIGLATGRYFTHRFTFDTSAGILIFTAFSPTTDTVERVQRAEAVLVAAGGEAVTFDPVFHSAPNLQVTAQMEASPFEARYGAYDNLTVSGATIHVLNSAGTSVGGAANWSATGI